ncbi:MAG TPA: DUF4412 domain-containing protein [Candidatus Omnitrophota bacterium]|nr:DUF4412 domain-containing protein [Candidatus Omnitrophota bacterium]HPT06569.1 DUF4412 domain-containing protein [Candidatus Omnitrophota bacterium]
MKRGISKVVAGFAGIALALVFAGTVFAQALSSVVYDSTMTFAGMPPIQSTTYLKDKKFRFEMNMPNQKMVYIFDGNNAYMVIPNLGTAMKMPAEKIKEQMAESHDTTDYRNIPGIKKVGDETIDGVSCEVFTYVRSEANAKIWVSRDIDFPIKSEVQTKDGTVITQNRNIRKNASINDGLFQLPAGVQLMEMPDMGNAVSGGGMDISGLLNKAKE